MEHNFLFFWGGPFSQWYKSDFVIGSEKYNCAEQYMMERKAHLFGDEAARSRIMATKNPREQKHYGRGVKNFDVRVWERQAQIIVFNGNMAKFIQNRELFQKLIETGNKELVEASPYDTIWGIGLGADDPRALDKSQWRGTNLLGQVLIMVREELKKSL